jgi:CheY-like chemotaxis protein
VTLTSTHHYGELEPGDYITISLTDTGSGILKENLEKVFEPFFSTKGSGGSGLGLSMVYGFVSQSNGLVEFESQNNRGTCISILLPISSSEIMPSTQSPDKQIKRGKGELILVVEDEFALRELVTKMIRMMGYEVIAASTTQEAISYFNDEPNIALVFTDIILSERQTGIDLIRRLRSYRPELKAIFTSGYSMDQNSLKRNTHTKPNFIQKPFTQIELSFILSDILIDL